MKRRTNQGGSVASFVVIGIILVVGLVSAVYILNQRGQQARKEPTTASIDKTASSTSKSSNNNSKTSESVSVKTSDTSQTKSKNMPTTGPGLSIFELAGVSAIATSTAYYWLSRRSLSAHSL